ncbi:hypothetical protein CDL12_22349 [Handroanthus impetiginosus]|uniref:Uncharacterized protein n=1 Tax=Handroanthus impetiginosus TaxID=429701 RepID=A0A2G9GII7_9LAMI|nr:hypothetical protein CDL12_22349 [Handroanthus impetiginosus]
MEGLIPMVYRSLKKKKTRRQYQCLSSGAALTYDIQDEDEDHSHHHYYFGRKHREADRVGGAHHRRYNSDHVMSAFSLASEDDIHAYKPKQLVRFRSHRMFSCLTGA